MPAVPEDEMVRDEIGRKRSSVPTGFQGGNRSGSLGSYPAKLASLSNVVYVPAHCHTGTMSPRTGRMVLESMSGFHGSLHTMMSSWSYTPTGTPLTSPCISFNLILFTFY